MALGFYSNWEMDHLNSILGPIYDNQSEVADALIGFLDPIDVPIDSLFDTRTDDDGGVQLFDYAETSSPDLLPSYSDPSILTLPSEPYPEFDCCKCPKRPRSCSDLYQPPAPNVVFVDDPYNGPHVSWPAGTGGWQPTTTDNVVLASPPAEGGSSQERRRSGCLSAQSVAARERRRRISEKTQELGRLIPGGNKMNTAEMFQAAFKYVKFLQAQLGILEVMDSVLASKSSSEVDEQLRVLVTSPTIQEKLYSEGKCIVSTQTVEALAEEAEIKSAPVISRDICRFVQSMG